MTALHYTSSLGVQTASTVKAAAFCAEGEPGFDDTRT